MTAAEGESASTPASASVSAGARLHLGFTNLSAERERLYGSLGVALAEPRVTVTATPAETVDCPSVVDDYVRRAVAHLDVPGARVTLDETLPRHVGLGSGTATALATAAAVARAYDRRPRVRALAPALGRGRRSGVGVAAFERGGFVLDGGRPTAACGTPTATAPSDTADGSWTVPRVVARHAVPPAWRFVLVVPAADPGRCDDAERRSMRAVVDDADPATADRIAGLVIRRVLPAVAAGDAAAFGDAVTEIGRLNGTWYADEQDGVYRAPVDTLVDTLLAADGITGAGQSSWGPVAYGVTTTDERAAARAAGERALDRAGVAGDVKIVAPQNCGARG
ncbi:beta-ribofuranosylaminobenzene 5'-phosphate synthase [Halarchaeum rubridurum]|uniref:Beta-ribofuranosylaminobenzene 5'-phosphate synthase n=1 Tax=Halarchaeum rubridurum TaxID=489911 RepID=A0A830FTM7_9EURY|nr:beta-ribofuranosylaminobenzene 5'-phosphate synthase family protein [Halarchaeum rubridurum]MBP1954756.1 beta-ribofuranosylaminobenzene 5'-phosphate synthase [Halarchaeum rubridurum]GGM59534.1 beta-ribofuranosylaminobenzene 5'-phosphate synthase [Halarchaeum rubridurum]